MKYSLFSTTGMAAIALAAGLSLPSNAVLAETPQVNIQNHRDRGGAAETRSQRGTEDGATARQQRRGGNNAQGGNRGGNNNRGGGGNARDDNRGGGGNARTGNRGGGGNVRTGNRGGNNTQVVNPQVVNTQAVNPVRRDVQTHGGNPSGGEQAGDGSVSMMDESSPYVFEPCADTPGGNVQAAMDDTPDAGNGLLGYPEEFEVDTNVHSQMSGNPDGFQPDTNVATEMGGNPDGFQPDTNVGTTMGGSPDGFQEERNLTAQTEGITAQIDGVTPCGTPAGAPAQ